MMETRGQSRVYSDPDWQHLALYSLGAVGMGRGPGGVMSGAGPAAVVKENWTSRRPEGLETRTFTRASGRQLSSGMKKVVPSAEPPLVPRM